MSDEQRVAVYREKQLVPEAFQHLRYVVKRPFWQFWDRRHDVFAPTGQLVMRSHSPVFRLRDELTIFADAAKTRPLLRLEQRKVIQLSTQWDVTDAQTGESMGTLRKRFARSLVRDTWDILDTAGEPVGIVEEVGESLLRRFFPILPSRHEIRIGDQVVARIRQVFRFFVKQHELDLSPGLGKIDPRLAVACTILVLTAESRREQSH